MAIWAKIYPPTPIREWGFVMLIKRLISLLNSENSPNHIMKVKEGIFVCENTVVLDQEIQKV